jgi:hypothetical protein
MQEVFIMRRFWTALIALLIVATVAWGAPSGSVLASKKNDAAKRSFAGNWTVVYYQRCAATLQNHDICASLHGSNFGFTVVPGTVSILQITDHLTVNARNHFMSHEDFVYTERAPKVRRSKRCDESSALSGEFTGICTGHVRMTGYVAKGELTTLPHFWLTSVHTTWDSPGDTPFDATFTQDTGYPAVPRTYNTRGYLVTYLLLKAHARPPAGLTIRMTVSRAP